ncbi:glycosyltransferase [Serinicoccus sp. LYQ131]|uniref:glycosyltransferase n=1 Tax=Serinicoccus sp. LYQ131 TaxID=3378797 RepID=UPI00385190A9
MSRRYLIVTPVRDEEQYLERTIASIVNQVERPTTWVIVDDGSTDRTPSIAAAAALEHPWIRVHSMPPRAQRVLGAGVVQAFNEGLSTVDLADVDFISKLDADLELDPRYFSVLMSRMEQDPRLGIASGQAWVRDEQGYESYERGAEEMSIGQAKFYRRETFDDIGGLVEALAWDGIDSHEARIRGWKSRAFADTELRVMTLRPEGASDRSVLRGRRRRGRGQWILGSDPLFMIASTALRVRDKPAVLGSVNTLYGYANAALTRVRRHGNPTYGTQVRRFQREALVLGKRRAAQLFEQRTAARWPGASRTAIGLLVSQHPTLSHTFIDQEIDQLRALGWDIHVLSLRRGQPIHGGGVTTTAIRDLSPRRMLNHAAAAAAHPWALLSTAKEAIGSAHRGLRPMGLAYLGQAVLLLGELRGADVDHVHVHFANNAAEVARLATHLSHRDTVGKPITYSLSIHGLSMHGATSDPATDTFPQKNSRRWGSLTDKVTQAEFVRCVDLISAQRVTEATGLLDIQVVHVGVDPHIFSPLSDRRDDDSSFSIGFVGRLAPEKQVPLLLHAIARMEHTHRTLLIAGAGPNEDECRSVVEQLGIAEHVEFLGPMTQAELPHLLHRIDVLAMSSRHEGTPIVLMEAMASGLPVVAPRVGGIPTLVEDGVSGLLTAPGDVTSLAASLDRLAGDPHLRRQLGERGRARVVSEFNAREVARELSALLHHSVTSRGRPASSRLSAAKAEWGTSVRSVTGPALPAAGKAQATLEEGVQGLAHRPGPGLA